MLLGRSIVGKLPCNGETLFSTKRGIELAWSSGLVATGGDSCPRGSEFELQYPIGTRWIVFNF